MVLRPKPNLLVSFVLSTRNRRDVLLQTLERIDECGLLPDEYEILVVDNASSDGTGDAVESRFPRVTVCRQEDNRGPVAKNVGMAAAVGQYVMLLDDDSWPRPGAVARMIEHFEADARLGAAVFQVILPDGTQECSAYPNVFIGCGTGIRRKALRQVGYLPSEFFMAAEEYDLSLRLLRAGWEIKRFDDLAVTHLKTPASRSSARLARMDVRNNLTLIARYFPSQYVVPFAQDWLQRYRFIAGRNRRNVSYWRGVAEGFYRAAIPGHRHALDDETFEKFSHLKETQLLLGEARDRLDLKRVLFVDLGKNIYAYWLAAQKCGLEVVGIADAKLSAPRRRYRGIPVLTDATARRLEFDAAIIANLSPVHAAARLTAWRATENRPVIDLFEAIPRTLAA